VEDLTALGLWPSMSQVDWSLLTKWSALLLTLFHNLLEVKPSSNIMQLPSLLMMDSTLDAKLDYKRKLSTFGITISGYHVDNGRFAKVAWKDSCHALHQKIPFCGVGSCH
jgi:hypothetical protein